MNVIKSRRGYVSSIDPVSGTPTWTTNIYEARAWRNPERAMELADGIGRVVALDPVTFH